MCADPFSVTADRSFTADDDLLHAQLRLIEGRVLNAQGKVEEAIMKLRRAFELSVAYAEYTSLLSFPWGDIAGLLAGLYERAGRTAEALFCDCHIKLYASEVKYSGAAVRLARMAPSGGEVLSLCKGLMEDVEGRPYFKRLVLMLPAIAEILQQLESTKSPGNRRAEHQGMPAALV
jgi:tetratricopeptide (TPR) repeat protein